MATSIEIWQSLAGSVWPDDFSLFATVPDGSPWTDLIQPVTSGNLYIYRARRLDVPSGVYSGWSNFLYLTAPYPGTVGENDVNNLYPNVNPGFITKAGIAIEPSGVPGQAVSVSRCFSLVSFDPGKSGMKRIEREDFRGVPAITGVVNGDAEYPLKLVVASTAENFDELFCTYFGAPTTTSVTAPSAPSAPTVSNVGTAGTATIAYKVYARSPQGDSSASSTGSTTTANATLNGTNYNKITWSPVAGATSYVVVNSTSSYIVAITQGLSALDQGVNNGTYSAPSAPTGNQQLWTTGTGGLSATIPVYYGTDYNNAALVRLYAGVRGDKLNIKFDKKSNTPLLFDCDLRALYEVDGLSLSTTGLSTATFDTLDTYSEVFAQVSIGGALADCNSFSVSIDRNLAPKNAFTGYAGPITHYLQGAKHKITATLWFSSDSEKQRYFGQVAASGVYSQINKIITFPVQIIVAQNVNAGGIVNQFGVYSAYATYEAVGEPIKGKNDGIMQDVEICPMLDTGSTATDIQITSVNSRTNSGIITAGSLITGINAGTVNPWTN